jgi:glucosamine-6-phosphate deaminase
MGLSVHFFASGQELGAAAAARTATVMRDAVAMRGRVRIIVATGNSQLEFIDALTKTAGLPWHAAEIFHMDEYAGMSDDHPASFRKWIRERVTERVRPASAEYIDGQAPDLEAECDRYSVLLNSAPIDLAFVGIGENGHIAFNDPPVADFEDPRTVKVVELDEACRRQQVGEGHFPTVADVPREALTLTCPALLRARHLICCVPDSRKAAAVRASLEGPLTEACPGSALRTHPDAHLFLDRDSAGLLRPVWTSDTRAVFGS